MSETVRTNIKLLFKELGIFKITLPIINSLFTVVNASPSSAKDSIFNDNGNGAINLLQLYLNPLYLFPIIFVIFTGLLVYVFGFKSTSSIPPTLHLFIDKDTSISTSGGGNLNKLKSNKFNKKDKKKDLVNNSNNKQQTLNDNKVNEKKSKQVKDVEQNQANKEDNLKVNKKSDQKQQKVNKKVDKLSNEEKVDLNNLNNGDDGEWTVIVSRKSKKSKDDKLIKTENDKKPSQTINKNVQEKEKINDTKKKSPKIEKDTKSIKDVEEETVKSVEVIKDINEIVHSLTPSNDDLMAEVPEYVMAKENRSSIKKGKSTQKVKKMSESEQINNVDVKPVDQEEQKQTTDKITEAIIKSYEGEEPRVNKNNQNKKKKNKPNANNNKITLESDDKLAEVKPVESNKIINVKEVNVDVDNKVEVNHVKGSTDEDINQKVVKDQIEGNKSDVIDDDGFKMPVNRKKRSRRE